MTATTSDAMLYKIPEAARLLRMSRSELYEQIKAGRIETVHQGRAAFITPAALRDYVKLLEREARETRDAEAA